jgi:hypothetical protein
MGRGPGLVASLVLAASLSPRADAQTLEPRSFSNAPVGMNFAIAGYGYSSGSVAFDPAVPLTDLAPEDFDPYNEDLYQEGADGFVQFLREIAPHLADPLTVHAVGNIRCQFPLSACEWYVQPNATDVQVNEFRQGEPVTISLPDQLSEAS